jgi:hypothetical protein
MIFRRPVVNCDALPETKTPRPILWHANVFFDGLSKIVTPCRKQERPVQFSDGLP